MRKSGNCKKEQTLLTGRKLRLPSATSSESTWLREGVHGAVVCYSCNSFRGVSDSRTSEIISYTLGMTF